MDLQSLTRDLNLLVCCVVGVVIELSSVGYILSIVDPQLIVNKITIDLLLNNSQPT